MTQRVKAFVGHTILVPREWAQQTGVADHVRQIDVLVYARNRDDMTGLLRQTGNEYIASQIKAVGRTIMLGNKWETFGLHYPSSEETRGVYLYGGVGLSSREVVRVNSDLTFTILGRLTSTMRVDAEDFVPTRH